MDPPCDPGDGGGAAAAAACSICLEIVALGGERSIARLHCGHEFHLDCIGSAFNAKGIMQCPNCRKVEEGNWLYAKGSHSYPDHYLDEWVYDEDNYDTNSDMPFRFHWCPFGRPAQAPFLFGEVEASPAIAYHGPSGQHAIPTERAITTAVNSCPHMAYFQLLQASSSSDSYIPERLFDGAVYGHHWSHVIGPTDFQTSHALPGQQSLFDGWQYHSFPLTQPTSHTRDADQASLSSATIRTTRFNSDGLVPQGSLYQQFGNGPWSRTRPQAEEHYRHQGFSSMHDSVFSDLQQSGGSRSLAPIGPTPSSVLDHASYHLFPRGDSSGRIFPDVENPGRCPRYAWEGDHFAPFPLMNGDRGTTHQGHSSQASDALGSSSGMGFGHRHDSERSSSQGRPGSSSYGPHHEPRMHHFI